MRTKYNTYSWNIFKIFVNIIQRSSFVILSEGDDERRELQEKKTCHEVFAINLNR